MSVTEVSDLASVLADPDQFEVLTVRVKIAVFKRPVKETMNKKDGGTWTKTTRAVTIIETEDGFERGSIPLDLSGGVDFPFPDAGLKLNMFNGCVAWEDKAKRAKEYEFQREDD